MQCHHSIIEAEAVAGNQYWTDVVVNGRTVREVTIDPGGQFHQFGGGASINLGDVAAVDASRLFYPITVPEDCDYQISLYTRAYADLGAHDLANDLWLRIATGSDIPGETSRGSDYHKMFSANNGNFAWAQPDHGTRYCQRLSAGQHVIEIAARSYLFQIDRVVAWCKEAPCGLENDFNTKPPGDYNAGLVTPTGFSCAVSSWGEPPEPPAPPNPDAGKPLPAGSRYQAGDVLALHYDIAPDLDDLHAMAAACTVFDCFKQIDPCVIIGAHGDTRESDYVGSRQNRSIDVATESFGTGNFIDTNGQSSNQWGAAANAQALKWKATLDTGGDVWLAEGGPSDFTFDVLQSLMAMGVSANILSNRIHTIQHSIWNEEQTDQSKLSFVQANTAYVKIDDGNGANSTADLNDNSQLAAFTAWANSSPCAAAWQSALGHLPGQTKLDFSDTVELLYILNIGTNQISSPTSFCNYFS